MWHLIALIRLTAMVIVLLTGVVLSFFIGLMSRGVFCWILSHWYSAMLWLLGVRVKQVGTPVNMSSLVVANHISWADILVIGSRMPLSFLAMKEVSDWPVIGRLAARAGTLFIERGNGAPKAIEQVAAYLGNGQGVVIFPEGRTSDGASVKRFHPRIFEAAIQAGANVIPVSLVYIDSSSAPFKPSRISFASSANFFQSVWKTAAGPLIEAEIRIFPELEASGDRQILSKTAFQCISDSVHLTLGSSKNG